MIDINRLRFYCQNNKIEVTDHAKKRFEKRKITKEDVIHAIMNDGEIIEQYENDYPCPSCLILGKAINQDYIHSVVSDNSTYSKIITAYYPDTINEWESDLKTRRKSIQESVNIVNEYYCPLCKAHKFDKIKNTYFYQNNQKYIIIKNVPCYECTQCGYIKYDNNVQFRINDIIEYHINSFKSKFIILDYTNCRPTR